MATDDLVSRMRKAVGIGAMITCLDEGADRIEQLHALLRDLLQLRGASWHEAEDRIRKALGDE